MISLEPVSSDEIIIEEDEQLSVFCETVDMAFIADSGYVMPTCVAITSLILNNKKPVNYNIYIIAVDLSDEDVEKFNKLNEYKENFKIHIVNQTTDKVKGLHESEDERYVVATESALMKFYLPQLIDSNKLLFMDGDILIRGDLDELFSTDLEDNYIAAVRDMPQVIFKEQLVGADIAGSEYINSGVMLMNLELMRKDNLTEVLLETKKRNFLKSCVNLRNGI